MHIKGHIALVTGGASGLGLASAQLLAQEGARVAILDRNIEVATKVAHACNGLALHCDVTSEEAVATALVTIQKHWGEAARIIVNTAGIAPGKKVISKDGSPSPLEAFSSAININLIGSYNVLSQAAAAIAKLPMLPEGERGIIINTASVAAYEGQIGQAAYAASKGGIVAMTLPLARELAEHAIRVMTIAPGVFATPMMAAMPAPVQTGLEQIMPFPKRLGNPIEFAQLVNHIVTNPYLNGEVIRLDAALRMPAR